jgi:putative transposase
LVCPLESGPSLKCGFEIVAKLRQVEVLTAQGKPYAEAIRSIGVTEATYYRWRTQYGELKGDQVERLKELEAENIRLRREVSDLTLEKLILREAALGNFEAPRVAVRVLNVWSLRTASPSGLPAVFWASITLHNARSRNCATCRTH